MVQHTWDGKPAHPGEVVHVELGAGARGLEVRLDAPEHGDPPPTAPPGSLDGLWKHEVVELFVAGRDELYFEVEFGPHGHYFALQLAGRRNVVRRGLPIAYEVRRAGDRWSAAARVPWRWIPDGPLFVNAYAIHGAAPGRRHLAWAPVPGEVPDFHRLEHFRALDLPRP